LRSDQQVFRRKEVKYLLQSRQYEGMLHLLRDHIVPDSFFESDILSLYFDTPDFLLIRRSLEKPDYKEKLRLRCYGLPEAESRAFLEIKKKCAGIVYKRREALPYEQALYYLQGAELGKDSQIFREMDWMLQFYGTLQPAMLLTCHRFSYKAKDNSGVRITFDRDIMWRSQALDLRAGVGGNFLFPSSHHLMELKLPNAMPLWLSHSLARLRIYPQSVSKYGLAYQALQAQAAGKEEVSRYA
jgi:hypothetical protein